MKALLELGLDVISDGFYSRPVKRLGALRIPQQIWQFGPCLLMCGRFAITTTVSEDGIRKFELDIKRFASAIASMDQVIRDYSIKGCNILDATLALSWLAVMPFKRRLGAS